MIKCQICKMGEASWAWQPFGPGNGLGTTAFLGSHYRGFPVIKICSDCARDAERGLCIDFTYREIAYCFRGGIVKQVPDYITDTLAWSEEW